MTGRGCRGGGGRRGRRGEGGGGAGGGEPTSLRQRQHDVLHQHGANQHFLTVDRQLGRPFLFGHHGDQHQAAAGHRPAGEPVDRSSRRRNRRTELTVLKAAQVESKGGATEIQEVEITMSVSRFVVQM